MGSIVTTQLANKNHHASSFLQLNSDSAASLLKQVSPYLILKRKQADIAIDFQDKLHIPKWKTKRQWQYRSQSRMKKLNARGKEV